ncbi:MAG: ketopantoate reductase family protein [Rhodospirillales bacterium]|nr:ketopantoate reductase family protein [Rhodospirillales bacterium]
MTGTTVIWGAGAVGGTLGAYLARAGEDILFVDNVPEHVAAINRSGLTIEGPIDNFTVAAKACLPTDVPGRFGRIILAVKAQHTVAASAALEPHLADDGYVVSAQNGLNEIAIARQVGEARTMGCFVNYGADYLEPGRIIYGGYGAVVLGELDGSSTPRLADTLTLFRKFEARAIATDNIWGYLWGKLGYGALLFATALTNRSIADALAEPRWKPIFRKIGTEAMQAARARKVRAEGFNGFDVAAFAPDAPDAAVQASLDAMVAHNAKSAKTHSGIWRDLAVRKRKTEVDAQIAIIADLAKEVGVDTPAIRALVAFVHDVEGGRRQMDDATLDALAVAVGA